MTVDKQVAVPAAHRLASRWWSIAVILSCVAGCATSPLGRTQLQLFPEEQLEQMGAAAFDNIDEATPRIDDPRLTSYVTCVANHILAVLPGVSRQNWEVAVFESDQQNAFALPGGKIGVYSGMTKLAESQDQLAAVIGHEVAHVIADHGNERISTSFAADTGLQLVSVLAAGSSSGDSQTLMSLLGLGTQVGVLLPFSRTQEEEADLLGLDYMASAGFEPSASIALWRKMQEAAGGNAPPEIMSTHPATGTRIQALQKRMPAAQELYRNAIAKNRRPDCR
jgi:predicted Zn-dependent protease